jgi:hypothetical protein
MAGPEMFIGAQKQQAGRAQGPFGFTGNAINQAQESGPGMNGPEDADKILVQDTCQCVCYHNNRGADGGRRTQLPGIGQEVNLAEISSQMTFQPVDFLIFCSDDQRPQLFSSPVKTRP